MDGVSPLGRAQRGVSFGGYFDRFDDGLAGGWVVNSNAPLSPVQVHAVIDGQETGQIMADEVREDIRQALGHPTGQVGFSYQVPERYLDGEEHHLSFRLHGGLILGRLNQIDATQPLPDLAFRIKRLLKIYGCVDGIRQGQIQGWVTRVEPGTDGGGRTLPRSGDL